MGVCVSVHTVERALADEDATARRTRGAIAQVALGSRSNATFVLHGTLARADGANRNARVYPRETLTREVSAYDALRVKTGRAYGRLEHPSASDAVRFRDASGMDERETSHRVVETYWSDDGKELYGYVEVLLENAMGREVLAIYERGELLGASTRSWSGLEVRGDGRTYVDDDMELLAFDLVRNPSTVSLHAHGMLVPVDRAMYEWPKT